MSDLVQDNSVVMLAKNLYSAIVEDLAIDRCLENFH